jgi:hypothetical protein
VYTVLVSAALLGVAPATALARHHHRRGHHARHHTRVRVRRFGTEMPAQGGSTGSSGQSAQSSDQNAGMVASFTNGTLMITLNDGSTVSGKVTPDTELKCDGAESTSMQREDDRGGDNGDRGGDNGQGDDDDNNAGEGENGQSCSTADLTPGTTVREAELRISSAGATWDKVELITSQAGANEANENEANENEANENEGSDS